MTHWPRRIGLCTVRVRLIHLEWERLQTVIHLSICRRYTFTGQIRTHLLYVLMIIYMYACTSEQLKATLSQATQINRHHTTPHYTTLHYTSHHTPHRTTPHHTPHHHTAPHHTTLHATPHHTTPHYTTHHTTPHHTTPHTTPHHTTPHYTPHRT